MELCSLSFKASLVIGIRVLYLHQEVVQARVQGAYLVRIKPVRDDRSSYT